MTVVVDLGCCDHPNGEVSVEPLIARFKPSLFYGFDPLLPDDQAGHVLGPGPLAEFVKRAAWVFDGELVLSRGNALDATALQSSERWRDSTRMVVPCFDFPRWLTDLEADDVIVKMDIEGAEFPVLTALADRGLDEKITLLLVEWHDRFFETGPQRRAELEARLRCEIEPWR